MGEGPGCLEEQNGDPPPPRGPPPSLVPRVKGTEEIKSGPQRVREGGHLPGASTLRGVRSFQGCPGAQGGPTEERRARQELSLLRPTSQTFLPFLLKDPRGVERGLGEAILRSFLSGGKSRASQARQGVE